MRSIRRRVEIRRIEAMNENEKIGVFVDLISLFSATKSFHNGKKIDYARFLDSIKKYGIIYRANAYGAYKNDEANGFIACLTNIGFDVNYVKATYVDEQLNVKKTDRSMDMVIDILRLIDRLDIVIISSLNTNLIPFIKYLKEKGVKVIIYACNVKKELRESANEYWIINEDVLEVSRELEDAEAAQ